MFRSSVLLGCLALTVHAEDPSAVPPASGELEAGYDRFTVHAGAFLLSGINTTLSLDGSGGQIGDEIDFEQDLGGDNSLTLFRADAEWRFAERHRVGLSWFDISQSTTHAIDFDLEWGDEVFPVSTVVETQFRTTISKLNYGYTFHRSAKHEVTALLGLHITGFDVGISAPNLGRSGGVKATAPLPVGGIEWRARLSDKLTSRISYEYFGISIDSKYTGSLSDFLVMLDYRFAKNWSLGAGYNRYVLRASVKSEDLELTLKHSYNGLIAFLSTSF
jgi:hypothetical protein